MFFDYVPEFRAANEDMQIQPSMTNVEYVEEKRVNGAAVTDRQLGYSDDVEEAMDGVEVPEEKNGIQKSKWMKMIEQCLNRKDILKTNQADFMNIFEEYQAASKLAIDVDDSANQFKRSTVKGMENMARFKELISRQIRDERTEKMLSKLDIEDY